MVASAHDRFVCDSKIGPHAPDRAAGRVAQTPKKIAFNDMASGQTRRPQAKNRSGNPWSTQQQRNCSRDKRTVTDDRRPADDWGDVLGPMFSCELLVGRFKSTD
jgi:hypothetical protein